MLSQSAFEFKEVGVINSLESCFLASMITSSSSLLVRLRSISLLPFYLCFIAVLKFKAFKKGARALATR